MRRRKPQKKQYPTELLIAVPLIALTMFCSIKYLSTPLSKLTAFSVEVLHPAAALQSIKDNDTGVVGNPANNDNDQKTEVEKPKTDDSTETSATKSLTSTPADITAMMKEAEAQFGGMAHDGPIVEKQYDAASATATFKNVSVRNTTSSHGINIEEHLNKKANLKIEKKSDPTVLIFHTHTTETYEMMNHDWYTNNFSTRSDKPDRNMVRVGDAICDELKKAGIGVIHDTAIYDNVYTGAYDRSRAGITKIMNENPSIKVVIDVHRDGIKQGDGTRIKPTVTVNNKKAAQVMIIAGCEDGLVKNFPTWEENLTFGVHLQQKAESLFPGIMRPIFFCERKYNMDVTPCSLLLEFGSDSNTLEEAEYSGRLLGISLAKVIDDYV